MSQKHDKGHQKRKRRNIGGIRTAPVKSGELARSLVDRGLASPLILDGYSARPKDNDS